MATFVYNIFKEKMLTGAIDLDVDTIKCALVTASYTPDRSNHHAWNDISNEVSGTGYAAGGKIVTLRPVVSYWYLEVSMDELIWPDSTITNMRGAVFYKSVSDASQSWLICYIDTLTDKSSQNSDFYFHMWPLFKLN